MKPTIQFVLTLLALVATFTPMQAQESDVVAEPNLYQVEVIIFRNADQSRTTAEIPRPVNPSMADVLDQELPKLDSQSPAVATSASQSGLQQAFTLVDSEQLILSGVSSRLQSLDAYDVISHRGWIQTAPEVADAKDVALSDLGVDPTLVTGNMSLFKRRYLHLAMDIGLSDGRDGSLSNSFGTTEPAEPVYEIVDSRRIRLENLVYFDHPEFGVIAVVAQLDSSS